MTGGTCTGGTDGATCLCPDTKLKATGLRFELTEAQACQLTNYGQVAVLGKGGVSFDQILTDITRWEQGKAYDVGVPYDDALEFTLLTQVRAFEVGFGKDLALTVTKPIQFSSRYKGICDEQSIPVDPNKLYKYVSEYNEISKFPKELSNINQIRAKVFLRKYDDEEEEYVVISNKQAKKFTHFEQIACAKAHNDDLEYALSNVDPGKQSQCSSGSDPEFSSEQITQYEARNDVLCYGESAKYFIVEI